MSVQQNHSEEWPDMKEIRESYSGMFNSQHVSEWINHNTIRSESSEYNNIHPTLIKNWKSLLLKETKHDRK